MHNTIWQQRFIARKSLELVSLFFFTFSSATSSALPFQGVLRPYLNKCLVYKSSHSLCFIACLYKNLSFRHVSREKDFVSVFINTLSALLTWTNRYLPQQFRCVSQLRKLVLRENRVAIFTLYSINYIPHINFAQGNAIKNGAIIYFI